MVDILLHELVPRHEILTSKEKKELFEKLGVIKEQLPIILFSDPIVKKINAKPGDVIKISRISETAGESTYYRHVA